MQNVVAGMLIFISHGANQFSVGTDTGIIYADGGKGQYTTEELATLEKCGWFYDRGIESWCKFA